MKKLFTLIIFSFLINGMYAQSSITGKLMDDTEPILFANVVLYNTQDILVKVESTDLDGKFKFQGISDGSYYIVSSFIGYEDKRTELFEVAGEDIALGNIGMSTNSVQLEEAVVTAKRALVEVKPDRMVFNVEGTINSAGDNGLGLLRKAPGVLVDNNNNITVLSRTGVLIYVDGKRLPLTGDELTSYLQNLPAEQIDRMDIITNPGAKYEAQGNAGIIDIRLKRNKSHGTNGSVSGSFSQGRYAQSNLNTSGNFRNSKLNTFGTIGVNKGKRFNEMLFVNEQNSLLLDETNEMIDANEGINFRWGTDFFIGKNQTVGFLVSGVKNVSDNTSTNEIEISKLSNPSAIDSVLIANNSSERDQDQSTYNINYVFDNKAHTVNVDLDYGRYRNTNGYNQPNRYFAADRTTLLTEILTEYDTPTDIDIYTAKVDYETQGLGGNIGLGTKLSKVATANDFLFYDIVNGQRVRDDRRSNEFDYDEQVLAGYVSYSRQLNEKWAFSGGLRVENTDVTGDLRAFLPELQEDPVENQYTNYFPSAGLTYAYRPSHSFALNYGRRINRPDYNVLNPFNIQLSELSFMKGNAFLNPEIVNNVELGYTLKYRYNFKISYSKTTDQITRLIAPADFDPRAGFISWANLAEQTNYGFNVSAPFGVTNWWNSFINFSAGYIDNQADYGDGAVVDVQAYTYSIFQQQTFTLPKGFTGEVSGYYAGPGVWGGVFEYDPSWSLNIGLQKKFFNNNMNVKLSVNDIFFESGWEGVSEFDGLRGTGMGNWDSRRGSISISYNFGNSKVKSRNRKTGIEDEAGRVNNG